MENTVTAVRHHLLDARTIKEQKARPARCVPDARTPPPNAAFTAPRAARRRPQSPLLQEGLKAVDSELDKSDFLAALDRRTASTWAEDRLTSASRRRRGAGAAGGRRENAARRRGTPQRRRRRRGVRRPAGAPGRCSGGAEG